MDTKVETELFSQANRIARLTVRGRMHEYHHEHQLRHVIHMFQVSLSVQLQAATVGLFVAQFVICRVISLNCVLQTKMI